MASPITSIAPVRPGNWRNQVDALLTPVERQLVARLASLRAEVAATESELAALRNVKRQAGVQTEVNDS